MGCFSLSSSFFCCFYSSSKKDQHNKVIVTPLEDNHDTPGTISTLAGLLAKTTNNYEKKADHASLKLLINNPVDTGLLSNLADNSVALIKFFNETYSSSLLTSMGGGGQQTKKLLMEKLEAELIKSIQQKENAEQPTDDQHRALLKLACALNKTSEKKYARILLDKARSQPKNLGEDWASLVRQRKNEQHWLARFPDSQDLRTMLKVSEKVSENAVTTTRKALTSACAEKIVPAEYELRKYIESNLALALDFGQMAKVLTVARALVHLVITYEVNDHSAKCLNGRTAAAKEWAYVLSNFTEGNSKEALNNFFDQVLHVALTSRCDNEKSVKLFKEDVGNERAKASAPTTVSSQYLRLKTHDLDFHPAMPLNFPESLPGLSHVADDVNYESALSLKA